ncbi:MAG TPA: LptA/OstA family protein [Thermotogota bacterium]|nr:LptA/OstA family protein [Thermotogota bacterium]
MKKTKSLYGVLIGILCLLVITSFSQDETLFIESKQLKMFDDRTEFYKFSQISKGDFFLQGESFTIFRDEGRDRQILAQEGIYLEFETGKATSLTLDYDLIDEKGQMTGNVQALISTSQSTQVIEINCDMMDIDNNTGLFAGKMEQEGSRVDLVKGNMKAKSHSFEYFESEEILILYGDVYIDDDDNQREVTGDLIRITMADDAIEGRGVSIKNKDSQDEKALEIDSDDFKMLGDRTEFYGPSTIRQGDFSLRSPKFTVYKEEGKDKRVLTEERSYVEFETGKATSNELDYDLEDETGTLRGDVDAVIIPSEGATPVNIKCDKLEIDGKNKVYDGQSIENQKINLTRGSLYAESRSFSYSSEDEKVLLQQDAYIDDLTNDQRIWGSEIQIGLDDDTLKGRQIRLSKVNEREGEKETFQMKSDDFRSYGDRDEFRGPSEIITKDITLVSENFDVLKADGRQETIQATQGVFIQFENGEATSTNMTFDLDTNQGTLTKDVVARIEQDESDDVISIDCDQLYIDQNSGLYSGSVSESPKVLITRGNLVAESKSFEYDDENQVLILIDEVYVLDPDNRRTILGDWLKMNLRTDETEGQNVQMTIITTK